MLHPTIQDPSLRRKEVIVAHKCAVATDDIRCSEIALNVLRGPPFYPYAGNAIDAAVAAALALGVVSMASSGLGGGAFMILRLAHGGKTEAIDMRETAPMDASEDMYHGDFSKKAKGPLSIAVPGELAGLYDVWIRHGSLPWESLVEPAVKLAMEFKISDYLYSEMCLMESAIRADKGLSDLFIRDGKLLQKGDICHNIKLAETLKLIAKDGMETFYNGKVGDDLIKDIQEIGGIIKKDDLRNYKPKIREPIIETISGLQFIGMPPPSAGGAGMILMLNILAQYQLPFQVSDTVEIHREIEALKHVFAVRLNLGDPDFVDVKKIVADMRSVEFAKELKATIDDDKTYDPEHYGGKWNELNEYNLHEHGTSHLSVVDINGNAVALTTSINYHFGAQILSQRTGILLNNQMDDFSIPNPKFPNPKVSAGIGKNKAQPANFIRPGKRPLSSMSPTIILKNGKLKSVIGASGGTLIIPGVSEVFLYHSKEGMDLLQSVICPRVYHQLIPNKVHYENFTTVTEDHIEVPLETREALLQKGHVLEKLDSGSAVQFIDIKELLMGKIDPDPKEIVAASDPRKGGVPAGY